MALIFMSCAFMYQNPFIVVFNLACFSCYSVRFPNSLPGELPENQKPIPNPDGLERITVLTIEMSELLAKLDLFAAEGIHVHAPVYAFALGLSMQI